MPRGRPKGSGKQVKAVPVQYDPCGETVLELARELISKYHPHLAQCDANDEIAYLFKNKGITVKGKSAIATAEKCSPKVYALSGKRFVITICYEDWQNCTDILRRAALDHELFHLWLEEDEKTGETKYKILNHDLEEFGEIVRRYGVISHALAKFKTALEEAPNNTNDLGVDSPEDYEDDLLD